MNFILKAMLKKQLKNMPSDQQEKILTAFEKDPQLFQNIAKEIQEKVKAGKDQQSAAMEVMMSHKQELSELMK